jgi:glycosyltransferase involved in cell wall biosynthesis
MSSFQATLAVPPRSSATPCPIILFPAYKPSPGLADLVRQLANDDRVGAVVVVNDGSGPAFQDIFEAIAATEKTLLLNHVVNLGKGAALKTGLNYAACQFPDAVGVVTADADGQHVPEDILRLAGSLIENPSAFAIGARMFSREIPLRSYLGNRLTGFVFACLTGRHLHDTQSGLRALPKALIPSVLRIEGQRYDYEMSMLFYAATKYPVIREIPIQTVYLEDNKSSHFNPLVDSAKIYYKVLQFYASSALAALLDLIVFGVAMKLTQNLLLSFLVGRLLIAAFVNFNINRRLVFESKANLFRSLARYYFTFAIFAAVSFSIIRVLIAGGMQPIFAKAIVETLLSILSFGVQGIYVFAERKFRTDDRKAAGAV